jgi:hypothetical protein
MFKVRVLDFDLIITTVKLLNFKGKIKSLLEFLIAEINKYDYEDEPNYTLIHTKINDTLKACGYSYDENFELLKQSSSKITNSKKTIESTKKTHAMNYDDTDDESSIEEKQIESNNCWLETSFS